MEGESLFNDATSIVMFEIFLDLVRGLNEGKHEALGLLAQLSEILTKIIWLAGGGAAYPDTS
jgi:NhaP-type Na+/H+ or K+/H+ antiporter